MRSVVISLAFAFIFFFTYSYIQNLRKLGKMTAIERANARIEEGRKEELKKPILERAKLFIAKKGFTGDMEVFTAGLIVASLTVTTVLVVIGLPQLVALVLAFPVVTLFGLWGGLMLGTRKQKSFNQQLVQALNLIAAAVEGGNGVNRAIESVIPTLNDPLRTELINVMESTQASKSIVEPLRELVERYPSKGLEMLLAALEIDAEKGGKIEPALRQAALSLQRDFELKAEAAAELSQTRSEFFTIVAIMMFIIVTMVSTGGAEVIASYTSPIGIVALTFFGANFIFGIIRAMKLLQSSTRGM